MACIEPLWGFKVKTKETRGLLNMWQSKVGNSDLSKDFYFPIRVPTGKGYTRSPLSEKFTQCVPTRLLSLSLACGRGSEWSNDLILKEPQCKDIDKRIKSTLNC